jgi:hypothetical protein
MPSMEAYEDDDLSSRTVPAGAGEEIGNAG